MASPAALSLDVFSEDPGERLRVLEFCTGVVRSVSAAAGELYDRLAGQLRLESTAVAAEGEGSGRGGGGGGGGSLERIRQQQAKASIAGILGNVGEATTLVAEVWKERVVLGDRVGQCDYVE